MLIDAGEKLAIGGPKQIVGRYQKLLYAPADKCMIIREQIRRENVQEAAPASSIQSKTEEHSAATLPVQQQQESFDPNLKPSSTIEYESHGAYIESPAVLTMAGERVNGLFRGKIYRYTFTVKFTNGANNVRFGMLIKTTSGVELGGAASASSVKESLAYVEGGSTYQVEFRFHCLLNPGVYFLNAGVVGEVNGNETYLHRLIDIAMFRVQPDEERLATGIVDFGCYPEFHLQQI